MSRRRNTEVIANVRRCCSDPVLYESYDHWTKLWKADSPVGGGANEACVPVVDKLQHSAVTAECKKESDDCECQLPGTETPSDAKIPSLNRFEQLPPAAPSVSLNVESLFPINAVSTSVDSKALKSAVVADQDFENNNNDPPSIVEVQPISTTSFRNNNSAKMDISDSIVSIAEDVPKTDYGDRKLVAKKLYTGDKKVVQKSTGIRPQGSTSDNKVKPVAPKAKVKVTKTKPPPQPATTATNDLVQTPTPVPEISVIEARKNWFKNRCLYSTK